MKKLTILFALIFITVFPLLGQDAFHTNLLSTLDSEFSVSGGNWLFFDNEAENLSNAINYGGTNSLLPTSNQDFLTTSQMLISSAKANPWDAGWNLRNTIAIQAGDVVLLTFFIRSEGLRGKVNFFAEDANTFSKEVILTMPIDTAWQQYFVPVQMGSGYNIGELVVGFHLGFQAQTIEIGGFTAINYGATLAKSVLPEQINNQFYEGWEPNAPWRAVAERNIDSLRKATLEIQAQDGNGTPVPNGQISVNMLRHEFAFGSAVTADKIAGNNNYNAIYENKILDLDGEGHGFNWVVFENDMKWPAWEQNWLVTNEELVNAVSWLKSHDIKIRGHTLVWPGFDNMPGDIQQNQGDPEYIKSRINTHLTEILTYPGLAGQIEEWDVLNETVTNRSLEELFQGQPGYPTGREIFAEIFQQAHEIDSTLGLYINDFVTLTLQQEAGSIQYQNLKSNIAELLDAEVGMSGLGFQGHIGGFPNGIPSVLNTLDDFYNAYGLTAKVTEFDLPTFVSESTSSAYLKDFLTATFGHPSMDGFLFWNFWDGSTWQNEGSNLFNRDWSMTQPGSTFVELVFDEWWTQEMISTDERGMGAIRAFKGMYEISYACDGGIVRDTISLSEDLTYTITCSQLATSVEEELASQVKVFPNPSEGTFAVQLTKIQQAVLQVYSLDGRLCYQHQGVFEEHKVNLSFLTKGFYLLQVRGEAGSYREKIHIK